jgi:hypothetical protein
MKMAKRAGDHKTVARLKEKLKSPTLNDGNELYANGLLALDGERVDEVMPIPWSRIVNYCKHYRLTERQTENMIEYINRTDNVIRADRAKQNRDTARRGERSGRNEAAD